MYLIGHGHTNTGAIYGAQLLEHRIDFPISPDLGESTIRHQLVHGKYYDDFYTSPKSLYEILNECILFDIVPIINLNAVWWHGKNLPNVISPSGLAKIAGILRDYLKDRGFKKGTAYIEVFNEPGKWLNTQQVVDYTNAVHNKVGDDFDVIYGNDEFAMLNWNYLGVNCKAAIQGVHPLTSLGNGSGWDNPKQCFYRIKDWKTIADINNKMVLGDECGSWFRAYLGDEGHQINKDIILECKEYEYLGCCIVSVDVNQQCYNGLLGYRIWTNNYSNIITQNNNFADFINFIKQEGTKMVYNAPQKLQAIANFLGFTIGNYEPELPIVTGTGFWQNAGRTHKKAQTLSKASFDASMEKLIKMILKINGEDVLANFECYYKNDGSWNPNQDEFAKSNPVKGS